MAWLRLTQDLVSVDIRSRLISLLLAQSAPLGKGTSKRHDCTVHTALNCGRLYLSWAHILAVLLKKHPQKKQKKNRMISGWLKNDRTQGGEKESGKNTPIN